MTAHRNQKPAGLVDVETDVVRHVLVVDDSRAQRRILSSYLSRWGYEVKEAGSGQEALDICAASPVDLVLSDWMMPGMNGLEFCQAFREMEREHYGYFILLTSKSEKEEIVHGLDGGADDFLSKPVAAGELRARIRAGDRILRMQRELSDKNRLVTETLDEISGLYDALDRDLIEARNLQQSLVRDRFKNFGPVRLSLMLHPSGHVGGDLVGFFPINKDQIGIFSIDVSGHGVASALMTARLASYFSGNTAEQNIALDVDADGRNQAKSPADVAQRLNKIFLDEMETELYFTLGLGYVDMPTGRLTMVQCGHPHAAIQRSDGTVEFTGAGGLPIGLIPDASWENHSVHLAAGDRLLMASDGVSECPDPSGQMLEEAGLRKILHRNARLRGMAFIETLMWDLSNYAGDRDFPDDISAIFLEYEGTG